MGQAALVGNEIDGGQQLLGQLVAAHFDVTAAAWIKAGDDGHWSLFIASKTVDEHGLTAAYRAIHPVVWGTAGVGVDPFDIRLIGATDPIAADLLDAQRRHARKVLIHLAGGRLGGKVMEEAYIYPAPSNL